MLSSEDKLKKEIKKAFLEDLFRDKYYDLFFNKKEVQDNLIQTHPGKNNFSTRLQYFLNNIDQFQALKPTILETKLIYSRIHKEFNGELSDLPSMTQITAVYNYFGKLNINEFFNYSESNIVIISNKGPIDALNSAESNSQVEVGESSKSSSKPNGKRSHDDSDCGRIKGARFGYKLSNA